MTSSPYLYPLCIQLPAPCGDEDAAFRETLALLQARGFYGVELNLLDFSAAAAEETAALLARYGLRLTMVASGARAKRDGLSLSSADEALRRKSVQALEEMLGFAALLGAGVICGFLKGGPSGERAACAAQLERSLRELAAAGALEKAPLYLEATNHYEALLVNTLAEGAAFAAAAGGPLHILPDTYHMNIEECSPPGALAAHAALYRNVHISDNNRYFPGFGAIDFGAVLRCLQGLGYRGTVTIEGRCRGTLAQDIAFSCDYLAQEARRAAVLL